MNVFLVFERRQSPDSDLETKVVVRSTPGDVSPRRTHRHDVWMRSCAEKAHGLFVGLRRDNGIQRRGEKRVGGAHFDDGEVVNPVSGLIGGLVHDPLGGAVRVASARGGGDLALRDHRHASRGWAGGRPRCRGEKRRNVVAK